MPGIKITLPSKVVPAFDVVKAVYIFILVVEHMYMQCGGPTPQAANLLPYPVIDNGQVYMLGLLVISGWLSHASFNALMTYETFVRKKLVRLMPGYLFGGLPMTLLGLIVLSALNPTSPREDTGAMPWPAERYSGPLAADSAPGSQCIWFSHEYNDMWLQHAIQFLLEIFTLGAWNPALGWWSANIALWFVSCLLTFHYVSPGYIKWLRARKDTRTVVALLAAFVAVRYASHAITLLTIYLSFDDPERFALVTHLWTPTQIWCPFIGCTLHNLATRVGMLDWRPLRLRIATDATVAYVVCGGIFLPRLSSDRAADYFLSSLSAYGNLLTVPAQILAVYLLAHNESTLDRVYRAWPTLWKELLPLSYPLYLMHWPIFLMFGASGAVDMQSPSGVVLVLLACVAASFLMDKIFVSAGEAWLLRAMTTKTARAPGAGQAATRDPEVPERRQRSRTPTLDRVPTLDMSAATPETPSSMVSRQVSFASIPELMAHMSMLQTHIEEQLDANADLHEELEIERARRRWIFAAFGASPDEPSPPAVFAI